MASRDSRSDKAPNRPASLIQEKEGAHNASTANVTPAPHVWRALQSAAEHSATLTEEELESPFWRAGARTEAASGSVSFLQAMFDALPSPIAIIDKEGVIVAVNEAWLKNAEIAPHYPALGSNYLRACTEDPQAPFELKQIAQGIEEVLSGARHEFHLEYTSHVMACKQWSSVQVNRFAMGGVQYVVVVHEDITRCKQVEEALQFSEEYFRALFERATDVILVVSAGGAILYPSPSVERVLGYPSEALKNRSCFDWIHGRDLSSFLTRFSQLLQHPDKLWPIELRFWHASGEWRTLEGTVQNLLSHRAVGGVVLNLRDITERKSMELQLRQSEAKNRAMLEAIPDLMFRLDQAGHVLDLKGGQLPEPSMLRQPSQQKSCYRVDSLQGLMERIQGHAHEVLATQQNVLFECHLSLEFQTFHYEVRLVPCGGWEVLVIVRDVTEQKKLQAQLLQADRMVELGTLAASMGHEINNPLTFVLGHLEELHEKLQQSSPPSAQEWHELHGLVQEALEGAERVRGIARDLKTYAHTASVEVGPVNVHVALDRALHLVANEIRHRAYLFKEYGGVPLVHANQARLEQVFLNLLLNAAHALPDREFPQNVIHIRTSYQPEGWVEIAISDNGKGIAPQHLEHIFEPFFTTKPLNQGTGLGLFVCHNIITGLGGSLHVRSLVGEGTTFLIELPVAEEERLDIEQTAFDPPSFDDTERDTLVHRIPDGLLELVGHLELFEEVTESVPVSSIQPVAPANREQLAEVAAPTKQDSPPPLNKPEPAFAPTQQEPAFTPTQREPAFSPVERADSTGPRVLIIDDEPRVARSLCRILRDCQTTLVDSGEEALALCQKESFELIICDILMPQVTGIDVYQQLCAQDETYRQRFVFMTGGAFTERSQAFLEQTTLPVLEKPFERDVVREVVDSLLLQQGK